MVKIHREVRIGKVSSGGVSLAVTFKGLGWIYGYELESRYASIGGSGSQINLTTEYFATVKKARDWIEQVTEEIVAIKRNQMMLARDFERDVVGEAEIVVSEEES